MEGCQPIAGAEPDEATSTRTPEKEAPEERRKAKAKQRQLRQPSERKIRAAMEEMQGTQGCMQISRRLWKA